MSERNRFSVAVRRLRFAVLLLSLTLLTTGGNSLNVLSTSARSQVLEDATSAVAVTPAGTVAAPTAHGRPEDIAVTISSQTKDVMPENDATAAQIEYVTPSHLWPQLRSALKSLGDRLEKPGKERLILVGSIIRAGDSSSLPILLIKEFPGRIHLTIQEGTRPRVIIFNNHGAASLNRLDQADADIIETIVNDDDEHFFKRQMEGAATRSLGSRFRLDEGVAENYTGHVYDIYQVVDEVKARRDAHQRVKLYYFNSDTLLLERVQYEAENDGVPVRVEVLLSNRQRVQGQQIPTKIVRTENGETVLTLTINSLEVVPGANDGIFNASPSQ